MLTLSMCSSAHRLASDVQVMLPCTQHPSHGCRRCVAHQLAHCQHLLMGHALQKALCM